LEPPPPHAPTSLVTSAPTAPSFPTRVKRRDRVSPPRPVTAIRGAPANPVLPAVTSLTAPIINDAEKRQPASEALHHYGKYLIACLPKHIQQFSVWKDELTIHIAPSSVIPVFTFLKNHTAAQFTQVTDICGVDYPSRNNRFEVVYNLLSIRHNSRIRVKTYADEATPVPSITGLYDGANWYEREAYDLFGILFVGHPDLRRIMTDYGFDGHPLRKDFPLTGYTEVRYDEEKKRVVVEPLEMTQAFRNFQGGSSVWEQVGEGRDFRPDEFKLPTPEPEEKKEEKK
jgi:NADH dehydrogenase (ubiquinone) Fe-S protein 3